MSDVAPVQPEQTAKDGRPVRLGGWLLLPGVWLLGTAGAFCATLGRLSRQAGVGDGVLQWLAVVVEQACSLGLSALEGTLALVLLPLFLLRWRLVPWLMGALFALVLAREGLDVWAFLDAPQDVCQFSTPPAPSLEAGQTQVTCINFHGPERPSLGIVLARSAIALGGMAYFARSRRVRRTFRRG
jgi:hypothetical protein